MSCIYNDIIAYLADNMYALLGVMILFGSTIAGKMLPFLSGGAEAAAAKAASMAELAVATEVATAAQLEHTIASLGQFGTDIGSKKGYRDKLKLLQGTEKHTITLTELQKSLNRTEGQLMKKRTFANAQARTAHKIRIANLRVEQTNLKAAILLEQGKGEASFAAGVMAAKAQAAQAYGGRHQPHGYADPAEPPHVAHGQPRHVRYQHASAGPPAHSHRDHRL